MNQLFRPSHGSAAEVFVVGWCGNCERDAAGRGCRIVAAWFRGEDPPEIVVDQGGSPLCNAFSGAAFLSTETDRKGADNG